ncbi:MAG TPA: lysylphosphatidylglycerol synthase transmembrane domain-containing protein [Prolixibacteraceae bacterium]|nr:lysylphosphatidylglycerol synthase transmembrane domain-containing protein [Prolixibacteraceae bacterium]
MKKKVLNTAKYLLFFGAGVTIFWLIYKDLDIGMLRSVLKNDLNYTWVWISLVIGILSHISRSIRWIYLIEPMGIKPGLKNTFMSVMFGYLMNLVLPRMGEISRCGAMAKYEKVPFMKLVGTVVTERIIDVIVLLLFTLIALLSQFGLIVQLFRNNPAMKENALRMVTSPWLIISFLLIILLLILFRKRIARTQLFRKMEQTLGHLREGLMSVKYVRKKGAFIFHSILIWFLYFLMLYCSFFAFDFTSGLSPFAALTTFVMGSFGMIAPVQGGLGTWHFMTKESLALYGISNENGIIFAFVAHFVNTLLVIVLGLISMLLLPLLNREK